MYEEMKGGRMTEIKKAPARTGANANTVVIAPFTKACNKECDRLKYSI